MNELMSTQKTMSSREIADLTGKEHRSVLRDIDILNENYERLGLHKAVQGYYTHPYTGNQQHREFLLNRIQTFDLMTGYSVELRIRVNRRWEELETQNAIDFTNPDTVLMLAQNWKKSEEERKRLQATTEHQAKQIQALAPKAALMDRVMDSGKLIDIGQAAKILELPFGRNTLFLKLRELGVFFKNRNEPKQIYIDNSCFVVKQEFIHRENHDPFVVMKVLVTQKGLSYLSELFCASPKKKELMTIQ